MSVGIEEVREYYNSKSDYMAKQVNNGRHQKVIDSLRDIIKTTGTKVLDLGCGIGVSSEAMAMMGAHVVAVDIADELLRKADSDHYHPNIQYLNADVTKLRLGRQYDVITIIDLLEHLNPLSLRDFFDVLREHSHENTIIYLNIPHYMFLSFVKENKPDLAQIIDEVYTPCEITQAFGDIGFFPVSINMYGLGSMAQYIDYVFIKEMNLDKHYQEFFKM